VQKNVDALLCPAVSLEIWAIEYVWDVMEQRLRRLPNQPGINQHLEHIFKHF
jgi:hypothetical protein